MKTQLNAFAIVLMVFGSSLATVNAATLPSASLSGVAVCKFDKTCPNEVNGSLTIIADDKYACSTGKNRKFSAVLLETGSLGPIFGTMGQISFGENGIEFLATIEGSSIRLTTDAALKNGVIDFGNGEGSCALQCEPIEIQYACE